MPSIGSHKFFRIALTRATLLSLTCRISATSSRVLPLNSKPSFLSCSSTAFVRSACLESSADVSCRVALLAKISRSSRIASLASPSSMMQGTPRSNMGFPPSRISMQAARRRCPETMTYSPSCGRTRIGSSSPTVSMFAASSSMPSRL